MTDEEKAEEFAQNEINKTFVDESEEVYVRASTLKQIIKNSHLKGLAEGRKDGYEQGKNNERELQCGKKNYEKDISKLEKENAELKKDKEWLDNTNNEQTEVILKLQAQIEKMKLDQKTAFDKGMKHLAKELKEYDRINGAWTDYFEHTVNKVLKWELERKGRTEWELAE